MSDKTFAIAMNPEDYYEYKHQLEIVQILSLEEPKEMPTKFALLLAEHPIIPTIAVETGTYWFGPLKQIMEKASLV